MDHYSEWIGRRETVNDQLSLATAQAAAATFDEDAHGFGVGAELPPLWHWFYFLSPGRQRLLGDDGHPQRTAGSFLPPIPLPRRMFAGARVAWRHQLCIGRPAQREATIRDVQQKRGRSGELAFVTLAYRILQDNNVCIEEEQDIVYRQPGAPIHPPKIIELPPLPEDVWSEKVAPDPRLLFRFSALTFNAHRIHYDRPYATAQEGYPGLVVHGPLTAILLLRMVRQHTTDRLASFRFRGLLPLFDLAAFRLTGKRTGDAIELQAEGPDGRRAMEAVAEVDSS